VVLWGATPHLCVVPERDGHTVSMTERGAVCPCDYDYELPEGECRTRGVSGSPLPFSATALRDPVIFRKLAKKDQRWSVITRITKSSKVLTSWQR